jgi:hypothetical protein
MPCLFVSILAVPQADLLTSRPAHFQFKPLQKIQVSAISSVANAARPPQPHGSLMLTLQPQQSAPDLAARWRVAAAVLLAAGPGVEAVRWKGAEGHLQVLLLPTNSSSSGDPSVADPEPSSPPVEPAAHPAAALSSELSRLGLLLRGQKPSAGLREWLPEKQRYSKPPAAELSISSCDEAGLGEITPADEGDQGLESAAVAISQPQPDLAPGGDFDARNRSASAAASSAEEKGDPVVVPEPGRLVASVGGMTCSMCAAAVEDAVGKVRPAAGWLYFFTRALAPLHSVREQTLR